MPEIRRERFFTRTAIPFNKKAYEVILNILLHGYDKNSSSAISMRSGDYSFSAVNLPNGYKTVLDNFSHMLIGAKYLRGAIQGNKR
jgi:hypothetical protein